METVYRVLIDRAERGMADLLLTIYDYAYCAGANLPNETTDPHLRDLLTTLDARYRAEVLSMRGWLDPPLLADEVPGWLLAMRERQTALGDAQPPEGWKP
jgi:hypothetical protein